MKTVVLKPLFHRSMECIGIYFPRDTPLQIAVQKCNAKWSKTNTCWYVPCTQKYYKQLVMELKGKAKLDVAELKKYLEGRKEQGNMQNLPIGPSATPARDLKVQRRRFHDKEHADGLSKENEDALRQYRQQLVLKGYSRSTMKTYTNEFIQFLQAIKGESASQFTVQGIKNYLQYCYTSLRLSENTMHSRINALKFYYEHVLGRDKFFWEIPRPKKHLILPKVLGEDELRRLFESANNLKHKAILFAAYSAGLRVSEVINLRFQDIDRERKQLFVYCSKGKKDRYVALSPLLY